MEAIVTVLRTRQFKTKSGKDALEVWVSEQDGVPFKVPVWDAALVAHGIQPGSKAKLYTDMDYRCNGTLNLKW